MKKALFALATLLLAGSAWAQGYAGIAGGMSKQDVNCSGWANCDKSDTGFKIYGGYKFSRLAAVEVGYTDFGLVRLNALSFFSGNYSATAYSVGGALFLPLAPKLTGIARLGLASVGSDYSATVGSVGNSTSDSSIEPYLGFGLAYALTPKLSLTGSFDYTRVDYPRGSGSATLFAVGLSYAF